jgi:hypothetical protein
MRQLSLVVGRKILCVRCDLMSPFKYHIYTTRFVHSTHLSLSKCQYDVFVHAVQVQFISAM